VCAGHPWDHVATSAPKVMDQFRAAGRVATDDGPCWLAGVRLGAEHERKHKAAAGPRAPPRGMAGRIADGHVSHHRWELS
jgi:hypothetical protein